LSTVVDLRGMAVIMRYVMIGNRVATMTQTVGMLRASLKKHMTTEKRDTTRIAKVPRPTVRIRPT